MRLLPFLGASLLGASTALAQGPTYHVDAVAGDDLTGDGSSAAPYRTLTHTLAAIDPAPADTTLAVAPGIYNTGLGESFPLTIPPTLTVQGSGAQHTWVSGEGDGVLFDLARGSTLSDLRVQRGETGILSVGQGFSAGATRYLRRVVVRDCDIGVHLQDQLHSDHGVALVNCVLHANDIGVRGESTHWDFQSVSVLLYGSTLTDNGQALQSMGPGPERYLFVYDSIVYGNGDDSIVNWSAPLTVQSSVLGDASLVGSNDNIGPDPQLLAPGFGDVHLAANSPAIDHPAGAAAWPPSPMWVGSGGWHGEASFEDVHDFDGDPRRVGAQIDPGADERAEPTLYADQAARLGVSLGLWGQAGAGELLLPFLAGGLMDPPLLGFVQLAPPWLALGALALDADGSGSLPLAIPNAPSLVGKSVYLQAVRLSGGGLDGSQALWLRVLP